MPKIDTQPTTPKPQAKPRKGKARVADERPAGKDRPVLYPDVALTICFGDGKTAVEAKIRPALTAAKMKEILDWEDENEYAARLKRADPSLKEGQLKLPEVGEQVTATDEDGVVRTSTVLLKDANGVKVVCWHIVGNREFKGDVARKYSQDILNRMWTGPSAGDKTFNGETFTVGETGRVENGQKRGVALVLAWQQWVKHCETRGRWSVLWPKDQYPNGPTLDIPIFFGISESARVIRTIDNVSTRSLADTIGTSPLFVDLGPEAKRECSRYMDKAVTYLWKRTGTGDMSSFHEYRSLSESLDFADRHPRLQKCVRYIYRLNHPKGEHLPITHKLQLSPGECAAIMYLMACGNSNEVDYRNSGGDLIYPRNLVSSSICGKTPRSSGNRLRVGRGPAIRSGPSSLY